MEPSEVVRTTSRSETPTAVRAALAKGVTLDRFAFANNPVWSPNGTRILFTQWMNDGFPTWFVSIAPDCSNPTVIVNGEVNQNKADWGTHP